MLQSMTGFGNASIDSELGKISLDIKSLNSKNLDLNYSLNPMFRNIESDIRSILTTSLKRGKIDFKINFKISENNFNSNLNHDVIKSYIKDLKEITPGTLFDRAEFLKIAITLPNSIETNRLDLNQNLLDAIKELVKNAIKELIDFRIQEGISMEKDLLSNLEVIQNKLIHIEELIPERMNSIKKRLKKNLDTIKVEIDLNRFEQELIYYLEKFDINEEIVRLKNHLIYFKATLNEGQIEKGKKLTFISQELGREINTIGSKSNNLPMQKAVVEMKNELEKIKEQLLNVL
ncbi:YicC family protein [Flavobacteriaceae bacterium]|nr:YicC family protein [Flavobacteriaceae bacterium]MDA9318912.1 YicC family protein [Flavobacteriaceae bacterium]MDB0069371.1 YicC family protein [Flavobacteriaceae bacterium]MDB4093027.1 YicC family protein [Flavobacteriaceae bacterium]MDB9995075.1 YicC family protein [Flavobacteriaceae bacterium]